MQHRHSAKLLFITSCMNLSFSTEFTEVNAGIRQKRQELELSCSSVIARVERCVFWIHGGIFPLQVWSVINSNFSLDRI